ncbi:MAG: bifunctional glutathionylspermidine amidase/synthase [Parvibaculum sp.]
MSHAHRLPPTAFGTLLGHAPGGVPVYSSDYDSVDPLAMPNRSAFRNHIDGAYMGFKWQCVELARRWMYVTHGYVFEDIAMAYDIFRLTEVREVESGQFLPLHSFLNGSRRRPEPGALMIWNEGGEFVTTGHVAIVTEVTDSYVRVAEQNVGHQAWVPGADWARELPARIDPDGCFWVDCTFDDTSILGWVVQTDDAAHAVVREDVNPALFNLVACETDKRVTHFLDETNPADKAFVDVAGGHRLATRDEDLGRYFLMSETARKELKRATNELNALFLHATDRVLREPDLLRKFGFPEALLPRIRQSWQNRRTHAITGRFDFAMTDKGLKVFEYNIDSASCHMECGRVQGLWAEAHGVDEGVDPGAPLFQMLVRAWQNAHAEGVVHIFRDSSQEEIYHARFMRAAIEAAGLEARVVSGVEGLQWGADGRVVDAEGTAINWVWKTWAWETALDELREEVESEEQFLSEGGDPHSHAPRLIDVLFDPVVMVFEPLWTLIPSNKAILPVLWEMMPNHPYLLEASFELTDTLRENGYVAKPIVGRCGHNIKLVSAQDKVLAETGGAFDDRDMIYQALFKLPKHEGLNVQVCTFSVDGYDAGACVRCDPSLVIQSESDLLPLRVVPDEVLLARL